MYFLIGMHKINTVHPERRIPGGLARNLNDRVIPRIYPDLSIDQVFIVDFRRYLQHVCGTCLQSLLSSQLEVVVFRREPGSIASAATRCLCFFVQQFVEHMLANGTCSMFGKNTELLGAVAGTCDAHQHLSVALPVGGNVTTSGGISGQFG